MGGERGVGRWRRRGYRARPCQRFSPTGPGHGPLRQGPEAALATMAACLGLVVGEEHHILALSDCLAHLVPVLHVAHVRLLEVDERLDVLLPKLEVVIRLDDALMPGARARGAGTSLSSYARDANGPKRLR